MDAGAGAARRSGGRPVRTIFATFFVARMRSFSADRFTAERTPEPCAATAALRRRGGVGTKAGWVVRGVCGQEAKARGLSEWEM